MTQFNQRHSTAVLLHHRHKVKHEQTSTGRITTAYDPKDYYHTVQTRNNISLHLNDIAQNECKRQLVLSVA